MKKKEEKKEKLVEPGTKDHRPKDPPKPPPKG